MITERFGTTRGAIRLGLSYLQVATGRSGVVVPEQKAAITRLIFVCQGNICRSSFAEAVAARRGARVASFGLSTDSGREANSLAMAVALELGYDLTAHRTTSSQDFQPKSGDLMLAMEVRQLHRLAETEFDSFPRMLLGSWSGTPHLHDPFGHTPDYMRTCLLRIERAVERLIIDYPGAVPS